MASMEESIQGSDVGNAILQIRGLDIKNVEPGLMGLGRSDPYFERTSMGKSGIDLTNTYRPRDSGEEKCRSLFWDRTMVSPHLDCFMRILWRTIGMSCTAQNTSTIT